MIPAGFCAKLCPLSLLELKYGLPGGSGWSILAGFDIYNLAIR